MNHVDHIPQTLASHSPVPAETHTHSQHGADMLQPDPRDTFFNSEPLSFCSDPLSIPIWFDSSVSLSLLLLRLCSLKLSFSFLCFVFAFCMINNEFDNVPLVKFNCLSHNTLHSPHDWPCSSWKCIARLSLLANIRGQRLPYCPLSRPTVCEYNTHINTHMPNTIGEKA